MGSWKRGLDHRGVGTQHSPTLQRHSPGWRRLCSAPLCCRGQTERTEGTEGTGRRHQGMGWPHFEDPRPRPAVLLRSSAPMFPPQKRRRLSSLPSRGYKSTTPMKSDPIGPLGLSGFALQPYEMLPRSFCSNVPGSATPLREPPGDKVPFLAAWGLSSSSAMAWGSWGGGGGRNSAPEWREDALRAQIPQWCPQGWLCPRCPRRPPEMSAAEGRRDAGGDSGQRSPQPPRDGDGDGGTEGASRGMGNGNGDTGL